jgi:sulfate adenylyltransferase
MSEHPGFTIWFTGLSGAGKTTISEIVAPALRERGLKIEVLDGDVVRTNLSKGLGFSKEDRDTNIRRIGFVAAEVTRHGGLAICAPIAPYDAIRKEVRQMIEPLGGFILVHVATSLDECEKRDRKGLYAKARAGILKQFTGISDPYEEPKDASLVLETKGTPEEAADEVLAFLRKEGYLQ